MPATPQKSAPTATRTHTPGAPVLALDGVSRSYGPTLGLAPVTLRIEAGAVCRVVGANGSGKTTLLRLAAGVLTPTTGTRSAEGLALYLRPGDGVRDAQTVRQAVGFAARATGDGRKAVPALDATGLLPIADRIASRLSAGQRARVSLAIALACSPSVVCLDEPTVHLDDEGRAAVTHAVRRLTAVGTAVLLATHDHGLLSQIVDRCVRLRDGTVEVCSC
jgi:ABC-type multidrug transport system ATPase subunit